MTSADHIVRAVTNDGSFRVITARATETVRGVLSAQKPEGDMRSWLAETIVGGILVRETMAPEFRVQVILQGAGGKGSLVADAYPGGLTRGMASGPADGSEFSFGVGALLQVVRSLPNGSLQQGIVEVEGDVSKSLMVYMQRSEQVTSFMAVSCLFDDGDDDELSAAGGYIVQVLPEASRGPLEIMAARLEDFEQLDKTLKSTAADPNAMLDEILHGVEFTRVGESEVHFGCTCNAVKVVTALATLGREEIRKLVEEGQSIDLTCDYCRTAYQVPPAQLRPLLEGS